MLALALKVVADHLVHAALLKGNMRATAAEGRMSRDPLFLGLIELAGNSDGRTCGD